MNKEQYFFEAFANMSRLGPGSSTSTVKASLYYPDKYKPVRILDIGCGLGTHTFLLAKQFPNAQITAIDNHKPFIEKLNKIAKNNGLSDRVNGVVMSMFDIAFDDNSFDIIWAEGSIYIIGFERGLKEWKRFLKPGGYLICTEISWLKENPSSDSYNFWIEGYPEIDTINNKIKKIEESKYTVKEHFICPTTDWTTNYYNPLSQNLDTMRKKYNGNEQAADVINMLQSEIDLYTRYNDEYSYVFYIAETM